MLLLLLRDFLARPGTLVEGGLAVEVEEGADEGGEDVAELAIDRLSRHSNRAFASCGFVPSTSKSRVSHNRTRSSRRSRTKLLLVAVSRSNSAKRVQPKRPHV